ncbi:MAG: methyltransferase domain-containing protein [Candidatus Bathyarchaeota archaeon]|nr:methyltransferase domain-containing protein [Candidatus Bathyarchaeota archaeon]
MKKRSKLSARLQQARANFNHFYGIFIHKYLKVGYSDKIYRKFEESPTWRELCQQVFGQYLGQYSYTPPSQIRLLVEELDITSQSHVLDLGSGLGGLSCYLASVSGCRVTGVDASPGAVKMANKRAVSQSLAERVNFEVRLLPDLPYPDCYFDAVIGIDSIYAVLEKSQLFRGCYRVLKPGGYIGFYSVSERRKLSPENPKHTRALRWSTLKPYPVLLEEASFTHISKVDLTKDLIQLASQWVEAMEKNRESLEKEMGKKNVELLIENMRPAWVLAEEGLLERALFKAQKPLKG